MLAQRRQIGLLRAIGLTPAQVTGVLVAHYLVLATLAAPFGLVAGALVAERLSTDAADALGAPAHPPPSVALLARRARRRRSCVVAAATALPAWRAGPDAGAGGARARARRHARRAPRASPRLALRLRLPVVVGLGAKDAFAQRGRTALTVSSLALAAALVATAMGFEATMDRLASDPALRAQPYELRRAVLAARPPRSTACSRASARCAAVARVREIRR